MVILALGLFCIVVGLVFLAGCFTRVDSPAFIERASGDAEKISRLHSLQEAWDKLGRSRQFVASSSAYLVMGIGLLLLYVEPRLAAFWWGVPVLLAGNYVALRQVRKHAESVLDPSLSGYAEVLLVIKKQLRACLSFAVVFAILALGAGNVFDLSLFGGST